MLSAFWIIIILSNVGSGEDQTVVELCQSALSMDCEVDYPEQGDETLCASNLHTYKNNCYFVKKKCVVPDLTISYLGPCIVPDNVTYATPTATPTSAPTAAPVIMNTTSVDEWAVLKGVFCRSSDDISCDVVPNSICGSDRKIYLNDCTFAKAQCLDDTLTVLDWDKCSSSIIGRRKRSFLAKLLS